MKGRVTAHSGLSVQVKNQRECSAKIGGGNLEREPREYLWQEGLVFQQPEAIVAQLRARGTTGTSRWES